LNNGLTRRYALIDFEASCLPDYGQSFPIEVALATVDGGSYQWLIRPAPEWQFWDWSPEAEALHGISREQLDREGLPHAQVLAELAQAAQGCEVYADADLDAFWLETLAEAARVKAPFGMRYLGELLVELGITRPQVVEALAEARRQMPREHTARDDALRLAMTLRLLLVHITPE
jgi:DNA polymerase III epsilon subunit-like protein